MISCSWVCMVPVAGNYNSCPPTHKMGWPRTEQIAFTTYRGLQSSLGLRRLETSRTSGISRTDNLNCHLGTGMYGFKPRCPVNEGSTRTKTHETIDRFWFIPICAMVETRFIGYGHPSNNGNPDSMLCPGRALQSLYAATDHACCTSSKDCYETLRIESRQVLQPAARTCQHYSRNGRRLEFPGQPRVRSGHCFAQPIPACFDQ